MVPSRRTRRRQDLAGEGRPYLAQPAVPATLVGCTGVGLPLDHKAVAGVVLPHVEEAASILRVALSLADLLDLLEARRRVEHWPIRLNLTEEDLNVVEAVALVSIRHGELLARIADVLSDRQRSRDGCRTSVQWTRTHRAEAVHAESIAIVSPTVQTLVRETAPARLAESRA